MTYDHEIELINQVSWTTDAIGNQIPVTTETTVLCGIKSIGRNEFYSAALTGLKPEVTFVVKNYEYSGQTKLVFDGATYKVLRTYATDTEEMELICEKDLSEEAEQKLIDTQLVKDLIAIIEEFIAEESTTGGQKTYYDALLEEALEGY